MLNAIRIYDDKKNEYLRTLLTEDEQNTLFGSWDEWNDVDEPESKDDVIEENLIIGIYFRGYDMMAKSLCVILE